MRNKYINLVLSAMFIAIGLVLPFLTGQIQQIGNLLLPMHIPVFLCGLICGYKYGFCTGLILPVFRSVLFSMPVLYPNAIAMSAELATYGLVSGLVYSMIKDKKFWSVYVAMLPAMIVGRVVWGLAEVILLGIKNNTFTLEMFLAGAFINAVPGLILQLVLIPLIISALKLSGVLNDKNT